MQAPAATFKIPIVSGNITILAVSELTPTYYDFCFSDEDCNSCCWLARTTFSGITHSGDLICNRDLLDYVKIDAETLTQKPICVFISGFQKTQITRFLGTNPALMVADHVDKVCQATSTLHCRANIYRFSILSLFLWIKRPLGMQHYAVLW